MRSFLYAIAIGLVGAALLHIVIILSLPSFTGRDAYTRVQAFGETNRSSCEPTRTPMPAAAVSASAAPAKTAHKAAKGPKAVAGGAVYVVKSGDTLGHIAHANKTTVKALK